MHLPKSSVFALTALLLPSVLAQVPASLSGDFNTEIQVNFNGDSSSGFEEGDTIPFADTANQPVFALGDASGVNTAISFMVMMIDTTDENNFIVHYAQTDFKTTGEKTSISASSDPKIPYAKPGSFGESGERKYTFLLYQQRGSREMQGMPKAGEKIDITAFNAANDLKPPMAGIAMNVNVGEPSADSPAPAPASAPASTPAPASSPSPASTSAAASAATSAPPTTSSTSTTTSTQTTTMVTTAEPTPNADKNISGLDGPTVQKPIGMLIGGGFVTEQPFPANGTAGPPVVANIAAYVNGTMTKMSKIAGRGVAAGMEKRAGADIVQTSASMAALVVIVAAVALV
ncbi:hypothetical protein EPUS_04931 [Endocarpon pusillum Z07020]|uniref:Yeast cell wall synthesis Kre9/Knh1 C-terminal domain-containing protein n=1 Tax=Endocarpon pusillum (strain Z07020 / HMAS-L-300199) TaxID=1263415 RepID=U1GB48_ENDPU|nr:uncharacterized protein EPUS_04931 [Endocarpon pusillum Z07020]ERF74762.1 hypothetical protein EPUS_04931 [Endocarpon pusillum Z07020]